MAPKLKKYRKNSYRLQGYDYSFEGLYFITLCTKDRIHHFGEIVDGKMILSEIGKIAESEWKKTFEMRPDMNLFMDEFVVMPDHFHAIIYIGNNEFNSPSRGAMHCAPTGADETDRYKNKFGPQSKNLASIVRGFKIGVTRNARILEKEAKDGAQNITPHLSQFAWQRNYHDHIIRNERAYRNIAQYIIDNPKNWLKKKKSG